MSTVNPIKLWVTLFRQNAFFSVLRMTSRLAFFPGYILYFFLAAFLNGIFRIDFDPVNLFFYAYGLMVFLDVLFFEILKLKESKFKDERAFFRKHRFSPKRIDAHARFITRVRVAGLALIPFIASYFDANFSALMLFFMVVFPVFSIEVYFRKVVKKQPFVKRYKAWADKHTDSHWRPNSSFGIEDVRGNNATSTLSPNFGVSSSNLPPYYGVSGYNTAGMITGSPTAIGGISN